MRNFLFLILLASALLVLLRAPKDNQADGPPVALPPDDLLALKNEQLVVAELSQGGGDFVVATPSQHSEFNQDILIVAAGRLNLRSGPSTHDAVIAHARRGDRVTMLSPAKNGWLKVNLGGRVGYVASQYLTAPPPGPDEKSSTKDSAHTQPAVSTPSRADIISAIITDSRNAYPGSCACPDDRDSAGRRCGRRSAYSKPGGYQPLCYPQDVSAADIADFAQGLQAD